MSKFAIRKKGTNQWFCYCHTTGEPLLRTGDPLVIGAEIYPSKERAEFDATHGVHPFFVLKIKNFEIIEL